MFLKKATIYEHENPEEMNDTDGQEDRIDDGHPKSLQLRTMERHPQWVRKT